MNNYYSYLNTSGKILDQYKGEVPFAFFIKKYFAQYKKYGSKDRKQMSHLCYCYFRLGKALDNLPIEEKILTGLFLCSTEFNEILEAFKPEWNRSIHFPIDKKLLIIDHLFLIQDVFPWKDELSEGVDHLKFCESFFIQPDLFLRLRPGYGSIVKEKLLNAGIDFKEMNSTCFALPNASKIGNIIELDKEAVVQDYSSQRISEFLKPVTSNPKPETLSVWDCCAGSGGKSLLLYDLNPGIELTVSDVRESILINLKKRFNKAGIKRYNSLIVDLTYSPLTIQHSPFDLILCDAPCTGSGTWSRTPEQLYFFDEKKIEQYASLQKKIVSNIIPNLKENGLLIYITCSVFKKENEDVINYIKKEFNLQLIKMPARAGTDGELLKGYEKKADTMFVAVMKRSL